jgi:hypothetical protein
MKTICTIIAVLAAMCSCVAAAADRGAANDHIRQEVAALVRQGDTAQARHRLSFTLPSGARGVASSLDVGQQWTLLAYNFRRSGEAQLARFAASEAVSIASRLSTSDASASERASFLTGVGLLCERILYDLPQAKSYYDAAVLAQPNDGEAKNRQRTADAKLKQRGRTQTGKQ